VSAVPGDFMREPADETGREADESRPQEDHAGATSIWQWLAIGVLVVCWLAEAALCTGRAP